MSQSFQDKYLGGKSYKFVLSIVSGLIAFLLVIGLIAGFVAFFGDVTVGSRLLVAIKASLNAIYLPSIILLSLMIWGALLYAIIMMISETSGGSAKVTILLLAVLVFGITGTITPLMNYRPEPTTAYLIVSLIVFLLLIVLTHLMISVSKLISQKERRARTLIVLPYLFLTDFFIVSLIFAMIHHIKYGVVEEGFQKLCTGILMPVFAIACLLIPVFVLMLLAEDDPMPAKNVEITDPVRTDENPGESTQPKD